jgi:hypothetical protein
VGGKHLQCLDIVGGRDDQQMQMQWLCYGCAGIQ